MPVEHLLLSANCKASWSSENDDAKLKALVDCDNEIKQFFNNSKLVEGSQGSVKRDFDYLLCVEESTVEWRTLWNLDNTIQARSKHDHSAFLLKPFTDSEGENEGKTVGKLANWSFNDHGSSRVTLLCCGRRF